MFTAYIVFFDQCTFDYRGEKLFLVGKLTYHFDRRDPEFYPVSKPFKHYDDAEKERMRLMLEVWDRMPSVSTRQDVPPTFRR